MCCSPHCLNRLTLLATSQSVSVEDTLSKVCRGHFAFPPHVDAQARDLVEGLLQREPTARTPLKQVLGHPFLTRLHAGEPSVLGARPVAGAAGAPEHDGGETESRASLPRQGASENSWGEYFAQAEPEEEEDDDDDDSGAESEHGCQHGGQQGCDGERHAYDATCSGLRDSATQCEREDVRGASEHTPARRRRAGGESADRGSDVSAGLSSPPFTPLRTPNHSASLHASADASVWTGRRRAGGRAQVRRRPCGSSVDSWLRHSEGQSAWSWPPPEQCLVRALPTRPRLHAAGPRAREDERSRRATSGPGVNRVSGRAALAAA